MNVAKELFSTNAVELSSDEILSKYRIRNDSGTGTLSCYFIAPGIYLCYNDIHLSGFLQTYESNKKILQIHHCFEGRAEYQMSNGVFGYSKPGSIAIYNWKNKPVKLTFPISHYHGISILLDLDILNEKGRNMLFESFNIDFMAINNRFCDSGNFFTMEADEDINHLLSELYYIPEKLKIPYIKLKVIELLLILANQNSETTTEIEQYYKKETVAKVKRIAALLADDLKKHYTISELSRMFNMSQTSLKTAFKGIYGKPIYTYLKECRMLSAAYMLKNTDYSIAKISAMVGYENSSKFTSAFKSVLKATPTAYRRSSENCTGHDTVLKFKKQ